MSGNRQRLAMFESWFGLTFDATLLAFESHRVVSLRLAHLATAGPAGGAEAQRMVLEKGTAFLEAATTLASGGSARTVIRRYRTHVRANERRLRRHPF
jgi:hypothetical protein